MRTMRYRMNHFLPSQPFNTRTRLSCRSLEI